MSDKVLVLGSNSFSGASFVGYLLNQGIETVGISRSEEPIPALLPYAWGDRSRYTFHQLDLNSDLDAIMDVVHEFRPDYFVNFAAQSMVAQSWQQPADWFQTNVVANVNLHDKLRTCVFLKRYVHVSTPEVYGSCQGDVLEDASYNPSTPYAVSRAACDMSLMSFFSAYNFPVVFTRAANVYGPGQQLYRIIPRTILFIRLGRKLQLHGGGTSIRSFIHIRDVSDGTWRIAQKGKSGEVYHLSTPRLISIRDLVELICKKMGVEFSECVEIAGERLGKDAAYRLDSQKARDVLGWKDEIDLDCGVEETIAWVDKHFNELKSQPFDYIHKK
ncbi:MAG: GDP-mannose 4,6-dehydratase [Candidatus Hinthialibacter antarcticus]|nr:GDP-mannose 4,6-dehydratase [Candidatus Hinthialibacter antarcticus]